MHPNIRFIQPIVVPLLIILAALSLASCAPHQPAPAMTSSAPAITTAVATPPVANSRPQTKAIRIRAGANLPFTDSNGNTWRPADGFADGETVERPDLAIANTKDPGLYQAERYSMTRFSWALPNGKYTVKLHFAETFEGITQAGERVFSFTVQGREFKDFDVFAKAGGPARAYIETVPAEITNGTLLINFTPQVENPQINGLEIIPGW